MKKFNFITHNKITTMIVNGVREDIFDLNNVGELTKKEIFEEIDYMDKRFHIIEIKIKGRNVHVTLKNPRKEVIR